MPYLFPKIEYANDACYVSNYLGKSIYDIFLEK